MNHHELHQSLAKLCLDLPHDFGKNPGARLKDTYRRLARMSENKTKPTQANVANYFAGIKDDIRRKDCETLARLMTKVTKEKPRMWGTSIVGFGSHRYKYESGREGETCLVGFSSRKSDISIYGLRSARDHAALLSQLGKHKTGKGCLYIRTMSDVDPKVLERLIAGSVAEKRI